VLVGVDIGGTKTHVRVVPDDAPERDFVVPSDSWIDGMLASDATNAQRLVRLLPEDARTPDAVLVVGAHGLDSPVQVEDFNRWLAAAFPGSSLGVNDVTLLAPAAGLGEAVCVVAGTGSKVIGRRADGGVVEAGGHGFLLGDPGSAPALARDAMRSLLTAHDEGEPPDELAAAIVAASGYRDVQELWVAAFVDTPSMTTWGALAPAVFAGAQAGSARAAAVIDDHGAQLAADVGRVVRRGALGDVVVCAGGVIVRQRLLREALAKHVDALGLHLALHTLDVPPVAGAVALARQIRERSSTTT
jgi:N-acetylglucosamine kinase-like BadF-type ATPase